MSIETRPDEEQLERPPDYGDYRPPRTTAEGGANEGERVHQNWAIPLPTPASASISRQLLTPENIAQFVIEYSAEPARLHELDKRTRGDIAKRVAQKKTMDWSALTLSLRRSAAETPSAKRPSQFLVA